MSLNTIIQNAREYLNPAQVDCVVYHSPCNDGSGAALSAWVLKKDQLSYVPRIYDKPFDNEMLRNKNVVVLDASFKNEHLQELRTIAKKIMIVDHHYSAMNDLQHQPGCFFDMEHSGAILAWYYFHGLQSAAPKLLTLIEDRDLWRWRERELSEPLYYGLKKCCSNYDFRSFAPYLDEQKLAELIVYGKSLVQANQLWCQEAAKLAQNKIFILPESQRSYRIMCREVDNDHLVSELSEYLYLHVNPHLDFVMLWSQTTAGKYRINFRSNNPHVDVSAIAMLLGGGGHKQAAGAVIDFSPLDLLSEF